VVATDQKAQQREVVCPFKNSHTQEECKTTIQFTLTDLDISRGIKNIICPGCNGSIFYEIYYLGGELRLDGPKAFTLL